MAWRWPCDKPVSEQMTHICITWSQWDKQNLFKLILLWVAGHLHFHIYLFFSFFFSHSYIHICHDAQHHFVYSVRCHNQTNMYLSWIRPHKNTYISYTQLLKITNVLFKKILLKISSKCLRHLDSGSLPRYGAFDLGLAVSVPLPIVTGIFVLLWFQSRLT